MSEEELTYAGKIKAISGSNPQNLYEHQAEAISNLKKVNQKDDFSGLVVIPTGGGKTGTAVRWLMQEAIDKGKKVLWIAHRHLLLEQATETFQKNAYGEYLINKKEFSFRIVSGKHDNPMNIKSTDDVLIVGKDSLIRNLNLLDEWLRGEEEIYFVIDEAHHATAKTYRRIISYLKMKGSNLKMLGLTATPFRTAEEEKGLLGQIFTDGILFKINLKELINRKILSRPEFEECYTDVSFSGDLGKADLESINHLDMLPEKIINEISNNRVRNKVIVDRYEEFQEKYGPTIVFALSRTHAATLKTLFEARGIASEFIVSGNQSEFTGITISNAQNEKNIEKYRRGVISVLINVNILTEGADLPLTKTVFLTRPTVSTILMTQMMGRALRGERAGGTKEAYIVSFIDNWQEHIAWVNPATLISEGEFDDKKKVVKKKELQLISLAKIEEFARILDDTVDTSELEELDFLSRVPIGIYAFTYLDGELERSHQILVYDSTQLQYENFINDLPELMKEYEIEDELIPEEKIEEISKDVEYGYFDRYMLPSYDSEDIIAILQYYAQNEIEPNFIAFVELDRKKVDLAQIAQDLVSKDLRMSEKKTYLDNLWDAEDGIIRIYFNKWTYFRHQLETEIDKINGDFVTGKAGNNVIPEYKKTSDLSLADIAKNNPKRAAEIKRIVYQNYRKANGNYYCANCGMESKVPARFQLAYINTEHENGVSEVDCLRLLCTSCNKGKTIWR